MTFSTTVARGMRAASSVSSGDRRRTFALLSEQSSGSALRSARAARRTCRVFRCHALGSRAACRAVLRAGALRSALPSRRTCLFAAACRCHFAACHARVGCFPTLQFPTRLLRAAVHLPCVLLHAAACGMRRTFTAQRAGCTAFACALAHRLLDRCLQPSPALPSISTYIEHRRRS